MPTPCDVDTATVMLCVAQGSSEGELQERLNAALHSLTNERDEGHAKREAEVQALKRQVDKLAREREDQVHRYQEEKHQALMIGEWWCRCHDDR